MLAVRFLSASRDKSLFRNLPSPDAQDTRKGFHVPWWAGSPLAEGYHRKDNRKVRQTNSFALDKENL